MKQLENTISLDASNTAVSKAKLDVIKHANDIVDQLEKQQKEAEEAAQNQAEAKVLEVQKQSEQKIKEAQSDAEKKVQKTKEKTEQEIK